jgi:hypothetical protein
MLFTVLLVLAVAGWVADGVRWAARPSLALETP